MNLRHVKSEQIKVVGHLDGKKYILEKICFVKPDAKHIEIDVRLPDAFQQKNSVGRAITIINEHGDIESGPDITGLKRDPGR